METDVGVETFTAVVTNITALAMVLMVLPLSSEYHHVITGISAAFSVYSFLSLSLYIYIYTQGVTGGMCET